MSDIEISIILPCRNEDKALPFLLGEIKEVIKNNGFNVEIIVSDSSEDKSPEIAKQAGVILVKHDKEGYGNACLEGFKVANGKYIIMLDADGSYNPKEIPQFVDSLKKGNDLIIGNRFLGKMEKGAMSFSHRYIGNPVLSFILKLFFGAKIKDSQCGMRGIKKEVLEKLNLMTTGMEFASEMIVKALDKKLKIAEVPINYRVRIGESKMKSVRDAWRHLRFMLLFSPLFLFFIPGVLIFMLGLISFPIFLIIGYQLIFFAIFARTYAFVHLDYGGGWLKKVYKYISIEIAGVLGLLLILIGVLVQIKDSILGFTLLSLGIQTIFSAFMLSILGIKGK